MYHRYESDYVSHHMHKRSNHQQSSLVPIPYTALCMSTRCHKAKGACASFAATNYMPDIHTKPFAYTLSNVWCITAFAITLGMPGKRTKKVKLHYACMGLMLSTGQSSTPLKYLTRAVPFSIPMLHGCLTAQSHLAQQQAVRVCYPCAKCLRSQVQSACWCSGCKH